MVKNIEQAIEWLARHQAIITFSRPMEGTTKINIKARTYELDFMLLDEVANNLRGGMSLECNTIVNMVQQFDYTIGS